MARGGGGGGRGGGGRGGRGHSRAGVHSRSNSVESSPLEAVIAFAVIFMIAILIEIVNYSEGEIYSETKLETFCQQQYDAAFSDMDTYEDNLLLTIVVYEDRYDYSYMTWVGDHINDETFEYLQGEGTELDDILARSIKSDYTHTLASDLSFAIRNLAEQIDEATEYGSYTCTEGHKENPSGLRNLSDMDLNETLLNGTIDDFREQTGIPLVLVVEDAGDIFG